MEGKQQFQDTFGKKTGEVSFFLGKKREGHGLVDMFQTLKAKGVDLGNAAYLCGCFLVSR